MTDKELKIKITEIMHELGITANLVGHNFIRDAIFLCASDPSLLGHCVKVYSIVAKNNNSTPGRVERAMRHAIEVTWYRGNIDAQQKYFSYTVDYDRGKPTNSEFIFMIADKINLEYLN